MTSTSNSEPVIIEGEKDSGNDKGVTIKQRDYVRTLVNLYNSCDSQRLCWRNHWS
jgi:hypothetical protein